jgi:hypothetical protein
MLVLCCADASIYHGFISKNWRIDQINQANSVVQRGEKLTSLWCVLVKGLQVSLAFNAAHLCYARKMKKGATNGFFV